VEYYDLQSRKKGKSMFKPLRLKVVYIMFKNSVRTSKRTPRFIVTKTNPLMMFKGVKGVYIEKRKKAVNTNSELLVIISGGAYILPLLFKGLRGKCIEL
jgi:hypothetical protein